MKKLGIFLRGRHPLHVCLPFLLAAMALLLTGCPQNEYIVDLKPQGTGMERTLTFYRADENSKEAPANDVFNTNELAAIMALYPSGALSSDPARFGTNLAYVHTVRGFFTNAMPNDVGGAGGYTNFATSLGSACFYDERFRGNDDLAGAADLRSKSADQVADLMLGWSQAELGQQPGYDGLHKFLDTDFRRDLKNASAYWLAGAVAQDVGTNATEEMTVRFGQYLIERGYFTQGDVAVLITSQGDLGEPMFRDLQRLVARKMNVPETAPIPASLEFLADATNFQSSLDKYLAGTEAYQKMLNQWQEDQKSNPKLEKPNPERVINDALGGMIDIEHWGDTPDHLVVHLSLSGPPIHSNGRWDETNNQVVWEGDISTNTARWPMSCYAVWTGPDEAFQAAHLGKAAVLGDDLVSYCLWRDSQDSKHGGEWDAFLSGVQPGASLPDKIDAFRFSDETPSVTNGPSLFPRQLIAKAIKPGC